MEYKYVISIVAENKLRCLQRVVGVFARNRLNFINMNVYEIHNNGPSCFNMDFQSEAKIASRVIKQLNGIVELLEINVNKKIPLADRGK